MYGAADCSMTTVTVAAMQLFSWGLCGVVGSQTGLGLGLIILVLVLVLTPGVLVYTFGLVSNNVVQHNSLGNKTKST